VDEKQHQIFNGFEFGFPADGVSAKDATGDEATCFVRRKDECQREREREL
jgi:hypothetical protein